MEPTTLQWMSVLVQVPIVAAFMWFVLKLSEIHRAERESRDTEWRQWIEGQNAELRSWLTHQSEEFRRAVKDERLELVDMLAKHESAAADRADDIVRRLE